MPDRPPTPSLTLYRSWHCVRNFGPDPVALLAGEVVLASGLVGERPPVDTTAWLVQP